MEARQALDQEEKTWPDSGAISKTPREVLPLLGFILPGTSHSTIKTAWKEHCLYPR